MTSDTLDEWTIRLEQYENRQSELQDRWVVGAAGGALAVTLTFIREVGTPLVSPWLLSLSWGGLSVALMAALFSVVAGRQAARWAIARARKQKPQEDRSAEWMRCVTRALNWIALIALGVGLAAVVTFGVCNLR